MVKFKRSSIIMIVAVLAMSLSFSSCETLRKKFTRKKKQAEEKDFAPVLEPQEYLAPEENPVEDYQQHYHLVKAWYRDLWTALDEKLSDKSIKYTLKQVFSHLDEMQRLLKPEKKSEVVKLRVYLSYYDQSLDSPLPMRNISRIKSDLRAFDRQLRDHLRIDRVKQDLVPASK